MVLPTPLESRYQVKPLPKVRFWQATARGENGSKRAATLMRVASHQLTCVEATQGTRITDVEITGVKTFIGLVMNLPYLGAIAQLL
jgi:hypothetical protein